ncbi:MAG: hypothetical protein FWD69_14650 [Polyangiaceae bacterium]|nr:hypothetical protein [Polyangiaceae bacterium]
MARARAVERALIARALLLMVAMVSFLASCIESPQSPVDYDAVVVPQGNGSAAIRGWNVTLTHADVALGPFYFCASASGSSTLCDAAVAEITSVALVDGLALGQAPLGRVHGLSGSVQSAAYDFGISWFDTQTSPTPSPVTPGPGHSMQLEGQATNGATGFSFTANVDVVPQYQGQNAFPTAPAMANVTSSAFRLEVRFNPADWLKQLDFDDIANQMATSGSSVFDIEPGSKEHAAILVGIKNLAPIDFVWVPLSTP